MSAPDRRARLDRDHERLSSHRSESKHFHLSPRTKQPRATRNRRQRHPPFEGGRGNFVTLHGRANRPFVVLLQRDGSDDLDDGFVVGEARPCHPSNGCTPRSGS